MIDAIKKLHPTDYKYCISSIVRKQPLQLHFSFLRTHPDATIMKIAVLYMVCAIMVPITTVGADLAAEGRALTDVAIAWPLLQTGDIFTNTLRFQL